MSLDLATIGIEFDTSGLRSGQRELRNTEQAANRTADAADGVAGSVSRVDRAAALGAMAVKALAGAFAAMALVEKIKEATLLASRYNELGIVMGVVGRNAGFGSKELASTEVALRKTGISAIQSRDAITKLISANIDLSQATNLARLAQDAAVIGGMNSSEAFARLIKGIQSAEKETLETMGLNVNFQKSYDALAKTLGKNAKDLTTVEKTQAAVNAVMEKAPAIAGVYEASLTNSGKQMRSMSRYIEDLKVQLGQPFQNPFEGLIQGTTRALKLATDNISTLRAGIEGVVAAIAPAIKIAAAYFAIFIAAPAIYAVVAAALTKVVGVLAVYAMNVAIGQAATIGLNTVLFGTSVAANLASGALTKVQLAQSVLFAAFMGWQIGAYLRNQFVEVRVAALSFVGATLKGWEHVKYGAQMAWEGIKFAWESTVNSMKSSFADYLSGVAKGLAFVGASDTSKQVEAYADSLRAAGASQKTFAEQTAGITAEHKKAVDAIDQNIVDMVAFELAVKGVTVAETVAAKTKKGITELTDAQKAAIKKEAEAYATLISAIRAKTEENRLEMLIGQNATESQKTGIKLDQDLASGKLKLGSAHLTVVRAALAEQAATESLLKTQNAEKDVLDLIIQSTIARNASKDALAAEYAMYGKNSDAREIAMIAIKSESELEKTLNDMRKAGKPITDEMIAQLRLEKGARDQVEQATMAQSKALSYAQQLADENKKFGIDYILDDKARAYASLQIEADLWQERIKLAGEGTEAQKTLQGEYSAWYQNQLLKPQLEAEKKIWESVEQTAHDTFISIFDSGKSAFNRLRDTLKNGLLDLLYQMTVKKWIFNIGAAVTGATGVAGAAQATGTSAAGSAAGSMVGGLFGAGGMAGSLMAGAGWLTGATTLSGSLAAGASLVGTGTVAGGMAGAGMIVGALAPIALGIAAAVAIWKKLDTSGTYHTGGASSASSSGVNTIRAESLGFEATRTNADTEKMTAGLVTGIVSILDSTAVAFGKTAGYTAATAFADDTSKDGAWGALLIGKLGEKIIDWQDTKTGNWAPKVFADGAAGQAQYLAALSGSVRTALDGIGLPAWAQTMLDGLGAAPAIEDIAKVVDSINATQRALVIMGERMTGFANLSDDTASALIKASGGIDALANNASAFYDIYYDEGEKAAATTKQVTEALAAVGLAMPATQKAYRAQVEAQLALGAAGAPAVAALLGEASAFAQLNPVLEATAAAGRAASDILNERLDLQKQLDQLTMTSVELLSQQRAALDESNRSLFDQVQAAQAAKIASDAAVQAAKTAADALASVNNGYQQQIDALVKASLPLAEQRALEVAGMDASTLALYERLEALKGDAAASAAHAALMESNQARADAAYSKSVSERQAAESAAAAQAQALLNQRVGMETTLYNLTHTASEQLARSRGLELASMDATLRPLQSQIFAMQDQASAAAQAATALENAAAAARAIDQRAGLQREMFQMQGDTAALRKLELEALDPSNRALKESIFALQDKMAADQAAAQAAAAAAAMAQQIAQAQAQAQAQAAEEQRRAVEEQVRAAEQLKNAWQGITTSIFDEVARIRGLMSGSDTSLSSAQTKFAIATAQARSGDQEAARLLPQLSQAMLQIADATAITALDLRRIQAQTAASLSQTGMGLTSQYGLSVPSYDVGTDYVPRTGLALIHEGERITPAAYNRPYTRDQSLDTSKLEAAVERLTATVERQSAELAEIKRSTRRSADTLDVVTEGGSAMRTTV